MEDNIMISICCITYNQKKYIESAIKSFLEQQVDFKYEIIIHDDCSNDGTREIIEKYAKEYPKIIKPIFQEENQYSKGVKIFPLLFKEAKGKYIALCEGDDYWCDKNKLQIQYDFMEKHEECSLVTNGCYILDENSNQLKKKKQPYYGRRFYSTEEVIMGDGDLFATNSMFFRSKYVQNLPQFYYSIPICDYPLTIHLATCGKVYFLKRVMSVYRKNAIGSWTESSTSGSKDLIVLKREQHEKSLVKMFNIFNEETKSKYFDITQNFLLYRECAYYLFLNNYDEIKKRKYKALYKTLNLKGKISLFLKRNFNYKKK